MTTETLPTHTADIPPARFSPEAKEVWMETPFESRSEIVRMCNEMTDEFNNVRAAAERDDTLAEFHKLAAEAGKTLPEVLRVYVTMEKLIKEDTTKGILQICENLHIDPVELFREYLASDEQKLGA